MRSVATEYTSAPSTGPYRVVQFSELPAQWDSDLSFAVLIGSPSQSHDLNGLQRSGLSNTVGVRSAALCSGDVIVPNGMGLSSTILYRESDIHHSVFVTNRCNSYCLMCSQPPTARDDSWLVERSRRTIRHITNSPQFLGVTGGEPLLLGQSLRLILDEISLFHPSTRVDVLTNGRLLCESVLADAVVNQSNANVSWLVPLYGPVDYLHDFVVQSQGAFDQTIGGLLNLHERRQPIQLRVVLIEPVLRVLPELCTFIGKNLPFVREVALMACEPIGFALANRELCMVDLDEWKDVLGAGVRSLTRNDIPHIFMNTPLCSIPQSLWTRTSQSISDWKNVYAEECLSCTVKSRCCGLFAWHKNGWNPSNLKPFRG